MDPKISLWYSELETIKLHLIQRDPILKQVFDTVDASGWQLHTVIKDPFPALIGAIIGQKISYIAAKNLRGQLYSRFGTVFTPLSLYKQNLSFLGITPATIVHDVTEFILTNNIDLNTELGIRSLTRVKGIGPWTVETTLLTTLKNWDLFPVGDKFLQTRLKRLYGTNYNITALTSQWAPYRSVVTWYLWRWF